jgi:hypothetical protein
MRSSLLIPLLLCGLLYLGTPVRAQEKDSRLEQILHPDPNRRFDLVYDKKVKNKGFYSPSGTVETKAAPVKSFTTSGYITAAYKGEKAYNSGKSGYDVSSTQKKKFSFLSWFQGKKYATKTASDTKDFAGSKNFSDTNLTAATHDYRGGGAFQSKDEPGKFKKNLSPDNRELPNTYGDGFQELKTIDDVRNLLNTSK